MCLRDIVRMPVVVSVFLLVEVVSVKVLNLVVVVAIVFILS